MGEETGGAAEQAAQPSLCMVLRGEEPLLPPVCWPLVAFDEVAIGRAAEPSAVVEGRVLRVWVTDSHVSTAHVRLRRAPDGWAVEDLQSKNGTLLNGTPCLRAMLADGDVIGLGATLFLFEPCVAAAPGVPAAFATLSPVAQRVNDQLARVAASDLPVLLLGESGVGKELAARAVHELSGRRGAFVGVNCGALPATLLEATLFGHRRGAFTGAHDSRIGLVRSAHDGTLFLDEVGELTPAAQVALLRVLQEREVTAVGDTEPVRVDARVVAATNRDLAGDVAQGRFREDLYARLAGLTARVPPLRDRRPDLGLLISAILSRVAPTGAGVRISARAARALLDHRWPQNIRELEMCLRAAGELAGWRKIDLRHLPDEITAVRNADVEREELAALMREHRGNIAAVARELRTSRMQVHRMLKRCAIGPDAFRG